MTLIDCFGIGRTHQNTFSLNSSSFEVNIKDSDLPFSLNTYIIDFGLKQLAIFNVQSHPEAKKAKTEAQA